jgi:single-strand DNA-binding protein
MSVMSFIGNLGRDVELKFLPSGEAVANLAVAYRYGKKGQDGKHPSQWVDCSLFGKRAESLAPHLTKGQGLHLILDDVHIRTYQKGDGSTGFALAGRVMKLEFAGSKQEGAAPRPAAQPRSAPPAQQSAPEFDGFDDDIPF